MIRAHQHARAGVGVVAILSVCWAGNPSWAESQGQVGSVAEDTRPSQSSPDQLQPPTVTPAEDVSPGGVESGSEPEARGVPRTEDQPWEETGAQAEYGAEDPLSNMSLISLTTKLGLGLGLVILLALGIMSVLKKSSLGRQLVSLDSSIRVVERTYLGPKKAVFLVQIGDRTLALGVTDSSISPLSEWGEGEISLANRDETTSSFGTQLKSILGKPASARAGGGAE